MFNRRENPDRWFAVAIKLDKKGKLAEPYRSLFNYYCQMTIDAPIKKYREKAYLNHFVYFAIWQEMGQLAELAQNLNSILPLNLRNNFNEALNKFNKITDHNAEVNYDLFATEDDFVDDHATAIKDLLVDHIKRLSEK